MVIIHALHIYLPKDLLVCLLTEQILSKILNFIEIALKSTYIENAYFLTIFVKRRTKSFLPMNFVADKYLVCQKSIFIYLFF